MLARAHWWAAIVATLVVAAIGLHTYRELGRFDCGTLQEDALSHLGFSWRRDKRWRDQCTGDLERCDIQLAKALERCKQERKRRFECLRAKFAWRTALMFDKYKMPGGVESRAMKNWYVKRDRSAALATPCAISEVLDPSFASVASALVVAVAAAAAVARNRREVVGIAPPLEVQLRSAQGV
mmetsp:Transcript_91276/g.263388  ORF Transcript_91276/g.263388 Transcript_91276/m.263388 type:complete len:182 (+) Transcript_91276:65-610(+)